MVLLFPACSGGDGPAAPPTIASVTVTPATLTLTARDSALLTASVGGSNGTVLTNRTVTWSTSDASVVSVSTPGRIRALKAGTARITATAEGKSGFADITVLQV